MTDLMVDEGFAPSRVAVLLEDFAQLDDEREPWRVMYPLAEVLLVLTCATVASCDDFEDIVAWGTHHLLHFCTDPEVCYCCASGHCSETAVVF